MTTSVPLTEKYELQIEAQIFAEEVGLAGERHVHRGLNQIFVHQCHHVVLIAQDAMIDVQFAQLVLVDAHLLLDLHFTDATLYLVPRVIVQFALETWTNVIGIIEH